MIEIPWQKLPEDTLSRLLEEIVTRDGTDYGVRERTVEERLQEARTSLRENRAVLAWDEDSESASLVDPEQLTD